MAGQDFVREIPVELPETESDHDVLATLWARRRIDDLVGEELANAANQTRARSSNRKRSRNLVLNFKLMTQYTSFVAIDDVVFTGTDAPKKVQVPVESSSMNIPPGTVSSGVQATVTVDRRQLECGLTPPVLNLAPP